jgi:hypothetical protein
MNPAARDRAGICCLLPLMLLVATLSACTLRCDPIACGRVGDIAKTIAEKLGCCGDKPSIETHATAIGRVSGGSKTAILLHGKSGGIFSLDLGNIFGGINPFFGKAACGA